LSGYLNGFLETRTKSQGDSPEGMPTLEEIKNDYILYLLDRTFRNKSLTARILNISRTALYDRLPPGGTGLDKEASWPADPGRLSSH
jgi:DNA-binding NtrC family response regulator